VIVRERPAVADRVVAVHQFRFDDEDIAVPMRGAFPLAAEYRVGHLAAVGDVVAHDGVRAVLIILCRGDFELRVFVFDGVHPALDGVRSNIALGRVQLPGAGEVGFVGADDGGEKEETEGRRAMANPPPSGFFSGQRLLGAFSPSLAALSLTARDDGGTGVRDVLHCHIRRRRAVSEPLDGAAGPHRGDRLPLQSGPRTVRYIGILSASVYPSLPLRFR
jgi:hypothetical protein